MTSLLKYYCLFLAHLLPVLSPWLHSHPTKPLPRQFTSIQVIRSVHEDHSAAVQAVPDGENGAAVSYRCVKQLRLLPMRCSCEDDAVVAQEEDLASPDVSDNTEC